MADVEQFKKIDRLDAPELAVYTNFKEGQLLHYHEPAPGLFIAESPLVIGRALDAGYEPVSVLVETQNGQIHPAELALLEQRLLNRFPHIPVYAVPDTVLASLRGYTMVRGMLCAMRRKPLMTTEVLCQNANRLVILEHVVNPTNVGAILRSAAALNMDAVLLTADCCDPLYRRAVRVSMGCVFQIPWTIMQPEEKVSDVKAFGFRTAALLLRDDSISIADERLLFEPKLAVVLGAEGDGLCEETIAACDYAVKIPMSHGVDSLNVAAASAVAFWQLGKRSV